MKERIVDYHGCLYEGSASVTELEDHELKSTRGRGPRALERRALSRRDLPSQQELRPRADGRPVLHHPPPHGRTLASDIVTLTEPGKAAGGKSVSSNDLIAKDGTIYELVQYPRKAWHAGTWNRKAWGIEISNRGSASDPYPQAQIDAVVWRARERRRKLNIPADPARIKRHRDVQSDKVDTSDSFPWAEVRRRIVAPDRPDRRRRPEHPAGRRLLCSRSSTSPGLACATA